ncbi:hypothetical protein GCM10009582_21390 [Arthrobacter flavus]
MLRRPRTGVSGGATAMEDGVLMISKPTLARQWQRQWQRQRQRQPAGTGGLCPCRTRCPETRLPGGPIRDPSIV